MSLHLLYIYILFCFFRSFLSFLLLSLFHDAIYHIFFGRGGVREEYMYIFFSPPFIVLFLVLSVSLYRGRTKGIYQLMLDLYLSKTHLEFPLVVIYIYSVCCVNMIMIVIFPFSLPNFLPNKQILAHELTVTLVHWPRLRHTNNDESANGSNNI